MQLRPSIRSLFPPNVVGYELADFAQASALHPEEEILVANAVEERIAEFRAGRHCAREALRTLGREPVAILAANRAPIWPEGVVGAITHCKGYCGAVVASDSAASGVGFDAQIQNSVSAEIWVQIASPSERGDEAPEAWRTVVFSAKEALYKAQYSITQSWLGFEEVSIDASGPGTFRAWLERDVPGLARLGQFVPGRYVEEQGFVFAAVYLSKRV
jgi:4'-phosphopantetheinyl transferase EntD